MAPRRVALFASCVAELATPGPALATAELLTALGCQVEFPAAQTCCGQLAVNSGRPGEAAALARRFVATFEGYDAVVSPSGSCTATVHHQYPRILTGGWKDRALALADRCRELSQFLARYGEDLDLELSASVTYHDSCHLTRTLGERDAPRQVLSRVRGLTLHEMRDHDVCCGFGGMFAVKYPELSAAMADAKLGQAGSTGVDYLVSADPACLLHVATRRERTGAGPRTVHIAQLLHAALTRRPVEVL